MSKNPAYKSSVSFFLHFSYFYSQGASFVLSCHPVSDVLFTISIISTSLSSVFTSSEISGKVVYKTSVGLLVIFYYFYSERALLLLDFCPSLPVQISAYKSSVSFFLRFCSFYSQVASFLLSCDPSVPVQICKKPKFSSSISLLVSF